jgi:hypothetical protein
MRAMIDAPRSVARAARRDAAAADRLAAGRADRVRVYHPPGVIRVPTPVEEWARRRLHGAL